MLKRGGLQLLLGGILLLSTAARGGDRTALRSASAFRAPAWSMQRIRLEEALDPAIRRGETLV